MPHILSIFITVFLFAASSLAQSAQSELDMGVQAYKSARYQEAIFHFRRSVALDPYFLNAHLFLATALAQEYVPGAEIPDNVALADEAIKEFNRVLDLDPANINSVKGMAYLYLQMKKFEDAKTYYQKAVELDPNDPENFYSIGVIDWTQSYPPRMELGAKLNLKPTDQTGLIYLADCWNLRQENLDRVEDGIKQLSKALQLRPDYDDAMAYINLMYRERAAIQCGDLAASEKDLQIADKWVDLTMATKKRKAETQRAPSSPEN